ncbi:MAG: hypothetical protein D6767_00880 [Candidatus Hydrogenedentota bacterium]|nr:MAG: hypothetical protein D6767_00880 [Candidatus Hydrogenedentota bacterium]
MIYLRHLFCLLVLISTLFCAEKNSSSQAKEKVTINPYADEVARFLAGLPLPEHSKLKSLTLNPIYQAYRQDVNKSWNRYREKTLQKIATWRKNVPQGKNNVLFYPFSGPDMLHATAFFPNKDEYILLALEPAGTLPDPLKEIYPMNGIVRLKGTLQNILGMGFFHTKVMAHTVGSHSFSTITGVILFFLSRQGYEILNVIPIQLDENGKEQVVPHSAMQTKTVKILFRKPKGNIQAVYYFSGDVSDRYFAEKKNLIRFLSKRQGFVTMLKAASYLMYRPSFDDIRNFILKSSAGLLTDSSGIPFHFFIPDLWDIQLYGSYTRPIPLFISRCQPDLKEAFIKNKANPLPFTYGYQMRIGNSHVLVIQRREKVNPYPKSIGFDRSLYKGINTYCRGNALIVEKYY